MSVNALLIGCGNIGAMYDLDEKEKVWSHAKAYNLRPDIKLTITDTDQNKLNAVAAVYKVNVEREVADYSGYDIVSITTPTTTHFSYLEHALRQSVPVVICEKPVVSSMEHIEMLGGLYAASQTKILVNYIRRFQPAYSKLRENIKQILVEDVCKGIIVKYKRGFLNNASHAIDLLEFLFEEAFSLENFHVQAAPFDSFDFDPTITGTCSYMNEPVSFVGVTGASYAIFEIEIFFGKGKVVICHSGDEIRYYSDKEKKGLVEETAWREKDILKQYMVPVINEAVELFHKRKTVDNFASALRINKEILNIIQSVKS